MKIHKTKLITIKNIPNALTKRDKVVPAELACESILQYCELKKAEELPVLRDDGQIEMVRYGSVLEMLQGGGLLLTRTDQRDSYILTLPPMDH